MDDYLEEKIKDIKSSLDLLEKNAKNGTISQGELNSLENTFDCIITKAKELFELNKNELAKVIVIFRKEPDGEIVALFPMLLMDNNIENCRAYVHLGQHFSANVNETMKRTKPATPKEYAELQKELEEHFAYRLVIVDIIQPHYLAGRMKQYLFKVD